ncbi:MAG: c-type cytochrome [Myxococcota bacterium]|nr:c-type cytochrome [Myxococcota bacterium]
MQNPTINTPSAAAVLCVAALSWGLPGISVAQTPGPADSPVEPLAEDGVEPDHEPVDAADDDDSAGDGVDEQDPMEELFANKCSSCHTVGKGERIGPDLADVHLRRSRDWLIRFVAEPSKMLTSDPDARELVKEYDGTKMPDLGLALGDVEALVDLMERCSSEPCNLVGSYVPVDNATPDDVAYGKALFLGTERLAEGGPACFSCHSVAGVGGMVPGGHLAVDLTAAFARYGDEGLDSALRNPSFEVMGAVFADRAPNKDEAFGLRSFFYEANLHGPVEDDSFNLLLAGLVIAVAVLFLLNLAWGRRLRGVRETLVQHRGSSS